MTGLLLDLLVRLESLGERYEELYDSEVREALQAYLVDRFVLQGQPGPAEGTIAFGLRSADADAEVLSVLQDFVQKACTRCADWSPQQRLAGLQNDSVSTPEGQFFDDFLGWLEKV